MPAYFNSVKSLLATVTGWGSPDGSGRLSCGICASYTLILKGVRRAFHLVLPVLPPELGRAGGAHDWRHKSRANNPNSDEGSSGVAQQLQKFTQRMDGLRAAGGIGKIFLGHLHLLSMDSEKSRLRCG
jgi:hypothetical protein